ncbi:MAG TPA: MmgE/PrpD family protein [Chloroflexota bacterium]|nr:MmgE/PrpD family protein [Chloroflexota bacterium]
MSQVISAETLQAAQRRPHGEYTSELARFAAEFSYDRVPGEVRDFARGIVLDTIGAIVAASSGRYGLRGTLGKFITSSGGTPEATLVGLGQKSSLVNAALYNGTLGYYCDIEAHHPGAIMHGPAIVVPAALAAAEARGASGQDVLAAVVLGVDVACRVSYAIDPNALYARAFHPTAVCGAFGAAAAVGRIIGLDQQRMANAFGLTANQASGLLAWASDHTEQSRPFNPGLAARNGATAALLAEAGMGAPQHIFDPAEKYNVFRAWSTDPRPEELLDRLYERFFLMELAVKLYACCAFLHPALDGILALLKEGAVTAEDVSAITLRFSHSGRSMIDQNELKSHRAQYILPIGLYNRKVVLDDILFEPKDTRIQALSERTRVVGDDDLERFYPDRYPSIVELTTRNGRTASRRVDWPKGYPQNPASAAELERKFRDLAAATAVDAATADQIVGAVANLEQAARLDDLLALMADTE